MPCKPKNVSAANPETGDTAMLRGDSAGVALIAAERTRQMSDEGWTPEHDDRHSDGALAQAAICYANAEDLEECLLLDLAPVDWPWDECWWKPSTDPIRNLVKAGALIAAEIDRLTRLSAARPKEVSNV